MGAARAAAEAEILVGDRDGGFGFGMGREHEADGVVFARARRRDLANQLLQLDDLVFGQHAVDLFLVAFGCAVKDFGQFGATRIADDQLEKEAVELGFGQRIGSFLVDRVLRGHHEERLFELADLAAGGDAFFLHRFEHGGLRLGRGAVDFVGEDELREDRARAGTGTRACRRAFP